MKKSLRRAVAVLLAVLMAMFSMPLSALAFTEEPDIDFDLRFGPLYNAEDGAGAAIENRDGGKGMSFDYSGLLGPALTYDKTNGTISVNQTTLSGFLAENEIAKEDYAGDWNYTYGVGDTFTVTGIFKNVEDFYAAQAFIHYSDNIRPVLVYGIGSSTTNAKKAWDYHTYDEYLEDMKNLGSQKFSQNSVVGLDGQVEEQNADNIYGSIVNISSIDATLYEDAKNKEAKYTDCIQFGVASTTGSASTISNIKKSTFECTDPDTGETGYTYDDAFVMATIGFIITGEGPIEFEVSPGDNGYSDKAIAIKYQNEKDNKMASYYKAQEGETDNAVYFPASIKFMGSNPYTGGDTPAEYTVTFLDAENGNTISSVTGETGTAVTIPALADYATAPDETYHYDTSWNETPATTIGTENKTYYVVNTPSAHTFGAKNYEGDYHGTTLAPATHAAAGHYTQTCSDCGYVYLGEEEALAEHTYGDATVSLAADGATVTENRVCTVDGAKDASASTEIVAGDTEGAAATCTQAGTKYVKAKVTYADGYVAYSNEVEVEDTTKPATGHTYDTANISWDWTGDYSNAQATATYACTQGDDTQEVPATMSYEDNDETRTYTATIVIDGTNYTDTKDYALPHDHVWGEETEVAGTRTEGTCVTAGGYDVAIYCTKCGEMQEGSQRHINTGIVADNHEGPVVDVAAVEESCTEVGYTAGKKCEACGAYTEGHEEIPAKGHNYEVKFTWNEAGDDATAAAVCANCGDSITLDCNVDSEVTKKATIKDTGLEVYTATATYDGKEYSDTNEVVIAAKGAKIVVSKADHGYVTGTITTEVGKSASKNLDYGTSYSVTAVASEGYKFVGWQIGTKVISSKTTYTDTAYKNLTLVPLFAEDTGDAITVIFYDMYGNVIKSYESVSASEFQAAMAEGAEAAVPAPVFNGYTFKRYSVSDDKLKALTESTNVWAQYEKNASKTYTVTVSGGTIVEANAGEISADGKTLTGATYDTKVKVTGEGVEAWTLNGKVAGYGNDFTFYVGADSEVVATALTGDAQPTTSIISYALKDDGVQYSILVTATVPSGYTIKSRGFVYGKELTDDELNLDNEGNQGAAANAGVVKATKSVLNNVDQFSLAYGLSAKSGSFGVKSYIVVSGPSGTQTIYSDYVQVTYA